MRTGPLDVPPLRVAAGQAAAVAGDVAANVATAVALVRRAAEEGARLLVLPEAFLTGYAADVFAGSLPAADSLDEVWLAPLRDAAREAAMVVVVSSPLQRDGFRTLSTVVIDADGRASAPYDKQHLSGYERDHFTPGARGATITVDGAVLGLSICYDGCFPEHARATADAGAIGYLNSAAYFVGSEHRRDLYYRARAIDNGMYVVFAGLVGRCGVAEFNGGSAIHDPEGRTVAGPMAGTGIVVADLDPAVVARTRTEHPMLADRRTLGRSGTEVHAPRAD
ncbi:carbon-nitrogen hydrolase family protein [Nocardioides sp. AE5]|uniref:carbon-nitrogen hydrolase family protein n=1 Tax=Nocardioides sp. AE5 TaxID=2962573 RepID=UPI0028811EFE|nr:carbon-nitrogen hydrolase family protein [Nocardioides sp. AE5]MDT0202038.1 carbon-nitrogen hydrolase family protein [Nocardioides sp. AE5]